MQPKVTLISHTARPLETLISCWEASRSNDELVLPEDMKMDDDRRALAQKIIDAKIPVAENVDFVFMLDHVSIALREQMVRHRIGSKFGQRLGADIVPDLADSTWWAQSMRILDMGTFATEKRYHVPQWLEEHGEEPLSSRVPSGQTKRKFYETQMAWIQAAYRRLIAAGMPIEDARNIIPLAAEHRISWKLNLAALMHIIGKRGCWILQLGIWEPVIRGFVEELATKVDPIFRRLINPPCISGDRFDGCKFKLDNQRRIDGEDEIPPCTLYLHNHTTDAMNAVTESGDPAWRPYDPATESTELTLEGAPLGWVAVPRAGESEAHAKARQDRAIQMVDQYRSLWQRNPSTGEPLDRA